MHMALLTSLPPFLQPTFTNPSHVLLFTLLPREEFLYFPINNLVQCETRFYPYPFVCTEIAACLGQPVDLSSFLSLIATCHFSKWFLPSSPLK